MAGSGRKSTLPSHVCSAGCILKIPDIDNLVQIISCCSFANFCFSLSYDADDEFLLKNLINCF